MGLHPLMDALAATIRNRWQQLEELAPLSLASDLEEISGSLDWEALFIRNELARCRGLRKMHLETARLGAGLQILHCVFFPDPCYDLPVFGADVVASPAGVSAAIADLSPIGGPLPTAIDDALRRDPGPAFRQRRELPAWGSIFSPHVCFIRPDGVDEEQAFVAHVDRLLVLLSDAVSAGEAEAADAPATVNRWRAQLDYCRQQKRNDKTRRVLEKAFNPAWAERYIEELLFDDPPQL
ncbi:MAG: phycocyanobilin:ferredoxin oxidoreductase [Cyanobacteria bacterium K_DeepCast_35m_m2_023]|nr:phycocyanobilin:ferredoxin oxidoreductase [Cyanobacteria bacterium K_DeepCast_35m_m2_023]